MMDRRHAAANVAKRAALKDEWLKLSRILADMRNRRGRSMPGWVTVQLKPIYTIKSQLGQWHKLRRMQVATGGQRGIMSYFSHAPHTTHPRNTRRTGGRRWVRCGCYGSLVTSGHGRSAGGDGGYGSPVATAGL